MYPAIIDWCRGCVQTVSAPTTTHDPSFVFPFLAIALVVLCASIVVAIRR